MAHVWSFNTTVRNPERMEHMLRALSEMEGVDFDQAGQEQFFGLLIQKRLYKPGKATLAEPDLIAAVHQATTADDLLDGVVARILQKYQHGKVNASGRGRTAAGVLNRFGVCIALQSKGPVTITPLGRRWLAGQIDDQELFTKFLLKWQYPNPIESGYQGFDIRPFVAVVDLIRQVNGKWLALGNKPVGVSKDEYRLFVPSLTKAADIPRCADAIITYRTERRARSGKAQAAYAADFARQRMVQIFGLGKHPDKALSDLRDYTDSSIRYFRMSGLIVLRGGNTHIDIAADKQVEAASLPSAVPAHAAVFDSHGAYLAYLGNADAVPLPWQNRDDLQRISKQLTVLVRSEAEAVQQDPAPYLSGIQAQPLTRQVDQLQDALNHIRLQKLQALKHNIAVLDEAIARLEIITSKQYNPLTARPSLDFEWYVSRALMVLNDAEAIIPSYTVGDDGIPIGFRANTADIMCRYKDFGLTVEVTLRLGRDQWFAEGQPVMRHLRDFEDTLGSTPAYCFFIAPLVHRDSVNTFWMSNTMGYEGQRQTIIPLTITQLLSVLHAARQRIAHGTFTQADIYGLIQLLASGIEHHRDPQTWLAMLPGHIGAWCQSLEA